MKQSDRILEKISTATEELSEAELEEVVQCLSLPSMRKALNAILSESDGCAAALLASDLTSPLGVSQAQLVQGKARGLSRAVEILIDLIQPLDKEESEDNGH